MLDPRIYRNGMMIVVFALIVVAFSFGSQAAPLSATLVPDSFNGLGAYATMNSLAARYPDRKPGSEGDNQVADVVAGALTSDGFLVRRAAFSARTVDGPRTIQTVTGTIAGTTPGTIVVVAHRDSPRPGSLADLSGTAVLLELAHDLSSQSQQRSIVLASTSGQIGAAGAAQLAGTLPAPVDAVIVLGDMAGTQVRSPAVVPWSDTQLVAPPVLRNTAAAGLSQQANVTASDESLPGQFLHLAFPLAASEQRPFAAAGDPAVLVSTSSARVPAPAELTNPGQIGAFGRTILQTVTALGTGPPVPAPSSYLRWQGKLIPAWAIRVLVLALILPVLAATVDGLARARRRGHDVARWILWVLSASLPFVLAALAVVGLRAAGVIDAVPGPIGGDALALGGKAVGVLAGLGCLILLGFAVWWRVGRRIWCSQDTTPDRKQANGGGAARRHAGPDDQASPGAAAAFLLVLCAGALVIWVSNPFAAALIVPALHLWLWIVAPERRLRVPWAVLLFVAGLAPGILGAYYYASVLGLGPAAAAWNAVLMLAGGSVSLTSAIEWSIVLGCVVSLALMIVRIARQPRPRPAETPITVRGPVTYAGPGSLGGTKSALRR
ncbi:MAG: M28 family peptidase [Solirubrobacterales bacterium]|nr:M28 family peptidase [Solirubrobacterales bacterium]